ncbi:MAG: pantetheine-phosphate adenylyltransferase [Fimbriimonadaceae bacterium]
MRVAIYPGSFDPPTFGHLDIVERAARLFDRLIIAVGRNRGKSGFLSVDERMDALLKSVHHLPNVQVESFDGLLIPYAQSHGASALIRGLRAISDFEYEFQMAMINRRLSQEIETVFLMTNWEHSYLSSSIVREVATLGGDISEMVPEPVRQIVEAAVRSRNGR